MPERKVVFQCSMCAEPIRDGDLFYDFNAVKICDKCVNKRLQIANYGVYFTKKEF